MEDITTKQLDIELSEEIAQGTYANLIAIAHSPSEFIFDFIRLLPGLPKAKVKSRIIMTPEHAKLFMSALMENISKYEATYGTIKNAATIVSDMSKYGGPKAQA